MQALKLPRILELQSDIKGFEVLKFRFSNTSSKNFAPTLSTRRESYVGGKLRTLLDRSSFIGNSAKFSTRISVSGLWTQRSLVTRAVTKEDSSQKLVNKLSLSVPDKQRKKAVVINENSTVRQEIGSKLSAIALSALVICTLEFALVNIAEASQVERLGQLRQAGQIIEKVAEGISKFRFDGEAGVQVLDKALTVVTGSTIVDPEILDQKVEAFIRGETDIPEELKKTVLDTLQGSWSSLVDVVTNFNPGALSESAGAGIQGFLEAGVERFAAFEISALVTLGERWLILTPLVVLPMAWQMRRNKEKSDERARDDQIKAEELSAEAQIRGERVKRELERIELKTLLLDAVNSLGEMALQPPRTRGESGLIRRRIQDILERLQELNPVDDSMPLLPEVASSVSASEDPNEPMVYVAATPTIDGDWRLIYVSETGDNGGDQELPQLPGIALDNIRQKVWQSTSISSTIVTDIPSPLSARNTAEVRFGPFGVLEIGVQGSWENLENGQMALVSFDTFSARPLEVFGNRILNDLPQLDIAIPRSLQQRAEWCVLYVDNHIRINRGRRGQLFLFSKAD